MSSFWQFLDNLLIQMAIFRRVRWKVKSNGLYITELTVCDGEERFPSRRSYRRVNRSEVKAAEHFEWEKKKSAVWSKLGLDGSQLKQREIWSSVRTFLGCFRFNLGPIDPDASLLPSGLYSTIYVLYSSVGSELASGSIGPWFKSKTTQKSPHTWQYFSLFQLWSIQPEFTSNGRLFLLPP